MNWTKKKGQKGQALAELVLCVGILFLMVAGGLQFTFLFLGRVQFDHACGIAAREFAFHDLSTDEDMEKEIWGSLGGFQDYFEKGTIRVRTSDPGATTQAPSALDQLFGWVGQWTGPILDYGGKRWTVSIRFRPPPWFALLFPRGIVLQDEFTVLRHPIDAP